MGWLLPVLAVAGAFPAAAAPALPSLSATTAARAPAQASVRIVSGAQVVLGKSADAGPYLISKASVRVEDGTRRPAQLVEFQ